MDVDEAGRHELAGGVHAPVGDRVAERSDGGNPAAGNRDVGGHRRSTGAVEDASAGDQDVVA